MEIDETFVAPALVRELTAGGSATASGICKLHRIRVKGEYGGGQYDVRQKSFHRMLRLSYELHSTLSHRKVFQKNAVLVENAIPSHSRFVDCH